MAKGKNVKRCPPVTCPSPHSISPLSLSPFILLCSSYSAAAAVTGGGWFVVP
uniref:Uncharacterized protein n=1 Tax=Anguilla anguilla TaxID=7936 RepID=A0A0E9QAU9_ANGAN